MLWALARRFIRLFAPVRFDQLYLGALVWERWRDGLLYFIDFNDVQFIFDPLDDFMWFCVRSLERFTYDVHFFKDVRASFGGLYAWTDDVECVLKLAQVWLHGTGLEVSMRSLTDRLECFPWRKIPLECGAEPRKLSQQVKREDPSWRPCVNLTELKKEVN